MNFQNKINVDILNLTVHKPSVGSCKLPQKYRARSVHTNKQAENESIYIFFHVSETIPVKEEI